MLAEAGGKTIDSLSFQAMMSRRMGQVFFHSYVPQYLFFLLVRSNSGREKLKKPSLKPLPLLTGRELEKLTEMISNTLLPQWVNL
jgi:hypothetical protein